MSKLKEIIAYILKKYPESKKSDLSKARLTKLVYLADWYNSVKNDAQLSSIAWMYNHYGPYVDDVIKEIQTNQNLFSIKNEYTILGNEKTIIQLNNKNYQPSLTDIEKQAIDSIIDSTASMNFSNFIETVYSTYPIAFGERYETLDLKKLAKEYNNLMNRTV